MIYDIVQNLYVIVYIDNIKGFYPKSSTINNLIVFLNKHYKLCDLGEVEWYLGMKINRADRVIILTQIKYINTLLQKYKMQDCSSSSMFIIEAKLKKVLNGYIYELQTLKDYQTLLEGIMYLIDKIHPNLAYIVS